MIASSVAYRAVGVRGDETHHIAMGGEAGRENLRRIANAWQRSHRDWQVEIKPEYFCRRVSGNEDPAGSVPATRNGVGTMTNESHQPGYSQYGATPESTMPTVPVPQKRTSRRGTVILGVVLGGLLLLGGGAAVARAATGGGGPPEPTRMESIKETCGPDEALLEVGDAGRTLLVRSVAAEEGEALPTTVLACVLAELDTPESVRGRMGMTTALDGTQTADWSNTTASWSYHPDRGMDLVIEDGNPADTRR